MAQENGDRNKCGLMEGELKRVCFNFHIAIIILAHV